MDKWYIQTKVELGGQKYLLSTTSFEYLGDTMVGLMGYAFETMLFKLDKRGDMIPRELYCERYGTQEEAEKHHNELVALLKDGVKIWEMWRC